MNNKTIRLVTSSILIALASVLSFIVVFKLPYGGSITLLSMLPIMALGYMYGAKWGMLCGVVYGVVQALLGAATSSAFAGLTGVSVLFMIILDYIIAFAVLGLAGVFKNKIKNPVVSISLGCVFAGLLRFSAHFLSGFILWGSYAQYYFGAENMNNSFGYAVLENFNGTALAALYSLIYNASYMLPEIIITVIGFILISKIKPIKEQLY